MRGRWLWAFIALASLTVLMTGAALQTGSPTHPRDAGPPWAARAQSWVRAFAATRSSADRVPYYDRDVTFDLRSRVFRVSYGLGGMLENTAVAGIGGLDQVGSPYLSRDGVVLTAAPHDAISTQDVTWTLDVGPSGVTRQAIARSSSTARALLPAYFDSAVFETLPDRYLRAWNSGDPAAATALYAQDATVRDTLRGLSVAGRDRVVATLTAAKDSGTTLWLLRGARLLSLPHERGDAVFGNGWLAGHRGWDRVVLLLEARLTAGCRGHVAVVLDLTGNRVRREERYYRLDDARRCLTSAHLPDGWWSSAPMPDPKRTSTGLVNAPGRAHTIVWNSDPKVIALLRWAYGRFAEAGLPAPAPPWARVETGDLTACLAAPHRVNDPFLTICTSAAQACVDETCSGWWPWARASVLHALGHRWADRRSTAADACPPVARWVSPAGCVPLPVDESAERSADLVAWGLMDRPWLPARLAGTSCAQLARDFRALTGTMPLRRGCAAPSGS